MKTILKSRESSAIAHVNMAVPRLEIVVPISTGCAESVPRKRRGPMIVSFVNWFVPDGIYLHIYIYGGFLVDAGAYVWHGQSLWTTYSRQLGARSRNDRSLLAVFTNSMSE